jgi:hypothetical protein
MNKLRLNLDALEVTTFDVVSAGARGAGTVQGHSHTEDPYCTHTENEYCTPRTCTECETCLSCYESCYTCEGRTCESGTGCTNLAC